MIFDFLSSLIVPKEKKFYPLFEKASTNLVEIVKLFEQFVEADASQKPTLFKKMEELEQIGDDITTETYREVLATFLTPFDREDIHSLITALDDIVDAVYGSAKRIQLYKVETTDYAIREHVRILLDISTVVHEMMIELRTLKNRDKIKAQIQKLKEAEFQSDNCYEHAIAELFDMETNVGLVFKKREVYSYLEKAIDYVEEVAIVFETILAKNA